MCNVTKCLMVRLYNNYDSLDKQLDKCEKCILLNNGSSNIKIKTYSIIRHAYIKKYWESIRVNNQRCCDGR